MMIRSAALLALVVVGAKAGGVANAPSPEIEIGHGEVEKGMN
jgi:hypothetical protein